MDTSWDAVTTIRKTAARAHTAKSQTEVNEARRSGTLLGAEKKASAPNKASNSEYQHLAKVDNADDVVAPPKLGLSVSQAIQKGRVAKGWSQKELAVKVNEKPTVVGDYEGGRAIPNQAILAKLERALGVKLRGKDIGSALVFGGAKK